jgi:trans-aconitate 2-methyltransferase
MAESAWNPEQYARFGAERSQPFFDLLSLVQPIPGGRAVDLGCGTGELTRVMHERSGARATIGIDNSETMLERSAQYAGQGLTFRLGTILRFAPRTPVDLIFSNAALQWVPDHPKLFERLDAGLAPGGQLAVQMPANHDHASHTVANSVAMEEPFRTALDGFVRVVPVQAPEWYAALLHGLGFAEQHVRLQVYGHVLAGPEEVIEWVRGTYLTSYQERLSPELFETYLERYRSALLSALPADRPYFYPFKRLLIWGRKQDAA